MHRRKNGALLVLGLILSADEKAIFDLFQQVVEKHPKAPIYHYGSYEFKIYCAYRQKV